MIKAIGTDLLKKSRIKKIYLKYGDKFLAKILSQEAKNEFIIKPSLSKKINYLSNNFASKEAVSKVLGTGFSKGVSPQDISVLRSKNGDPFTRLSGKANLRAKDLLIDEIHISVSDTEKHSLAFAIGETL